MLEYECDIYKLCNKERKYVCLASNMPHFLHAVVIDNIWVLLPYPCNLKINKGGWKFSENVDKSYTVSIHILIKTSTVCQASPGSKPCDSIYI